MMLQLNTTSIYYVIIIINRCNGEMKVTTSCKKVCKVNIDISKPLHMKFKQCRQCDCRCKCKCNIRYKGNNSSVHNERQCKRKAMSVGDERIHSKRNNSINNNNNNCINNSELLSFKVDLNEASKTMVDYNKNKQSSCSKGLVKKKMTMSLNGLTMHKKKLMKHTLNKMIKYGSNAHQQGKTDKDSNNIMVIKSIESNNNRIRSTCMSPLNQSVKIWNRKYYTCKSLSQERFKRNALKTQDTKLIELHNKIKKISALIQGSENETSSLWLKSPKLINRIRTKKKIEEIYKKINV